MKGKPEMQSDDPDIRLAYAYLLNEMPEEERAAFQQRLFTDEALFAKVSTVETDLIDALVRSELNSVEAQRVRRMLSESSQEERVTFAAALARREQRAGRYRFHWEWGALAACLALAATSGFLLVRNQRLRSELALATPAPV